MQRRTFFQRLFGSLGAAVTSVPIEARSRSVVVQESPVAGFQFHRGAAVWSTIETGQALALVREPDNVHDPDAVAVYHGDDKLGYVPRAENSVVARMLDRGERLEARISSLSTADDPWARIRFTVSLV